MEVGGEVEVLSPSVGGNIEQRMDIKASGGGAKIFLTKYFPYSFFFVVEVPVGARSSALVSEVKDLLKKKVLIKVPK